MKILVTGAAGFLGSHIVERLLAHGAQDLRCLVRSQSKRNQREVDRLSALEARYPDGRLEIVTGNLRYAADAVAACRKVDLVIHAAAAMNGSPAEMFLDSVVASRNLLGALPHGSQVRVILISSFSVIGAALLGRGALIDESAPLEPHPEERDVYSFAKLTQEQLFWKYREERGLPLTVLRPGVIYGPGSSHFSNRVGLRLFGRFLHLGGRNLLPLTYVENCAEAVACAALRPGLDGEVYHIVDDDVVSSREYLRLYQQQVSRLRTIRVPYPVLMLLSRVTEWYSSYSRGQLPPVFTPYKTACMWGGNRFSNRKLHSLGWNPIVSTEEGLRRSFHAYRQSS